MTEKSYVTHVSTILGVSLALMLFIFALVAHHSDIPGRLPEYRGALLGKDSSVAERIKPVAQLVVAPAETPPVPTASVAAPPLAANGQQTYQATCIACHGTGVAGSPKLGDKDQWGKRLAKGKDTLYASALKGVQGSAGVMPAKGGNPALSDAAVKAAVDYMLAQAK